MILISRPLCAFQLAATIQINGVNITKFNIDCVQMLMANCRTVEANGTRANSLLAIT